MFILFFKTVSIRIGRSYLAIQCKSIEEAIEKRTKLFIDGYDGQEVVYTSIKEGRV